MTGKLKFRQKWMSFPEIGLSQRPENLNFGEFFGQLSSIGVCNMGEVTGMKVVTVAVTVAVDLSAILTQCKFETRKSASNEHKPRLGRRFRVTWLLALFAQHQKNK